MSATSPLNCIFIYLFVLLRKHGTCQICKLLLLIYFSLTLKTNGSLAVNRVSCALQQDFLYTNNSGHSHTAQLVSSVDLVQKTLQLTVRRYARMICGNIFGYCPLEIYIYLFAHSFSHFLYLAWNCSLSCGISNACTEKYMEWGMYRMNLKLLIIIHHLYISFY